MSDSQSSLPLLYSKYAEWWPLLSGPDEYIEESQIYTRIIVSHCTKKPLSLLELGSGGGNNAVHMKNSFTITLVDISNEMLDISRKINPECVHIQGDMRTLNLNREFDSVFIHDAISHMISKEDLHKAMQTAYKHCRAGGVALFCPDNTLESFRSSTSTGGNDSGNKGLRYLEWTILDDSKTSYSVYMIYLLRDNHKIYQSELDCLHCGLFSQDEWLSLLREVGFKARTMSYPKEPNEGGSANMFIGEK